MPARSMSKVSTAFAAPPLDDAVCEQILRLANKQIQPMKSTFSPSTYRRAVATKLAIHTIRELWDKASG